MDALLISALTPEDLLLLFFVGCIAGTIDAISGGGGLLTIPALLSTSLSPVQALATNKLQGMIGTLTSSFLYWRKGLVDFKQLRGAMMGTLIGSALGSTAISFIDSQKLSAVIPLLLMGFALYFALSPKVSDVDQRQLVSHGLFAGLIASSIGFYDGFFGPGTGSFFTLALVALLGCNIAKAIAHSKVLNLCSNVAAVAVFAWGGHMVLIAGAVMAVGQILGSVLGTHLAVKQGARLIKPLLITVSLAMSFKLGWQHWGTMILGK
jgi:hypothetical protein